MLHALLLGAALFVAAPLDARHAALLDALSSDSGGMSCPPAELRSAAAGATIESVGRVDGDDVVVAHLNGGCLCGAHNCPVYTLRLTAAKPRILMTTFGYGVSMHAGSPLPRIVVRSHDSASISFEETYAYRGGRYVLAENARVNTDTGVRTLIVATPAPAPKAVAPAARTTAPDPALMRWAQAIPAVRCVPAAFGAWSAARTNGDDASGVPVTPIPGATFARTGFAARPKLTIVARGGGGGDTYFLARVRSTGDAVLAFDGAGGEDTFTAVIAGTPVPPRAVAAPAAVPRAGGIGLGSTRAAVESALGAGRANVLCGLGVVHYSQSQPRGSVAELWVFYRNGIVVALARAAGA